MTTPLLNIKNLQVQFSTEQGSITAVEDVSFELQRGEIVGVVGESGSGKSVTSLSVMRLLAANGKINKGSILFKGQENENVQNIAELPEEFMTKYRGAQMGMVFQEPMSSLNPTMRCGEQVEEAVRLHLQLQGTEAKQRVLELFTKVQLPDPKRIYKAFPHQLSGGQKQRVMIAMAVSCNPELLIADEPTTALDVTVQKSILNLIKELRENLGCAVLFITHDLGVVAEIADRVVVMYQGRVVETGEVEQVFKCPQHNYTKSLIACRPPLNHKVYRLPTVSDFMAGEKIVTENARFRQLDQQQIAQHREKLYANAPILAVENLNVWFPKEKNWYGKTTSYIKAVDEVSFTVYPGETLGLVGESGCGKTTLSRALLRLQKTNGGTIRFEDKDILQMDSDELKAWRKDFQIIFQDPYSALNPRITVGQAIKEPMTVHNLGANDTERYQRTLELLEKVGMKAEHYQRYPHEFSGGQKQRICIARALALEPKFIICDESVSALDVSVQAQVLNLLMDLQEDLGLTYIFISHDLSVVKLMSDRLLVMHNGKIVESGTPEEIYLNPKQQYTRNLIDAIPKGI